MIYIDSVHLISDESYEELHSFAKKIGLKRRWFQPHKRHPHYDILSDNRIEKAIEFGAKKISSKKMVRILNQASYI